MAAIYLSDNYVDIIFIFLDPILNKYINLYQVTRCFVKFYLLFITLFINLDPLTFDLDLTLT